MDKKRYQREMDRISMSQAFRAALTEAMAGEKPARRPRRAWRTALLAAALCGALAVSALALSPTLRQAREGALGGYARYAPPEVLPPPVSAPSPVGARMPHMGCKSPSFCSSRPLTSA